MLGLGAIDFDGLCGLGDVLSPSAAADVAWTYMPYGTSLYVTEANFKNQMISVLSGGKYALVKSSTPPNNIAPDSLIVSVSPENSATLLSVLAKLNADGYYFTQESAAAPVSAPKAPGPAPASISWTPMPGPQPVMGPPPVSMQQTKPQGSPGAVRRRPPVRGKGLLQDKSKLYWVMGIGGAVLVVAIALIASKE